MNVKQLQDALKGRTIEDVMVMRDPHCADEFHRVLLTLSDNSRVALQALGDGMECKGTIIAEIVTLGRENNKER